MVRSSTGMMATHGCGEEVFDFDRDVGFFGNFDEVSFSFCFMFSTAQGDNDGGWL